MPEEHLMIHKLRWKAYKERGDMLAVRFCLNGFNNKEYLKDNLTLSIPKKIKQGYLWIRQNSYEVRKTHGWHTEEGLKRISNARKGTMPVKDKNNMMIGTVKVNHPKVLSGEWVHHSKGSTSSEKTRKLISDSTVGENNPRYSGISDDDIVNYSLELFEKIGEIPSYRDTIKYVKYLYGISLPQSFSKWRFKDKTLKCILEEKTETKFNSYKRGSRLKDYQNKIKEIIDD